MNLYLISTLKCTTKATTEDVLKPNTLKGTKTAFLTPKRYDEHPRHFYVGVPPRELYFVSLKARNKRTFGVLQINHHINPKVVKNGVMPYQVNSFSSALRCIITPCFTPQPLLREGPDRHLMDHVVRQVLNKHMVKR